MSEHLKRITTRAKSIRRAKPGMKWVNAVKQASKELKHKPSRKAARKKIGATLLLERRETKRTPIKKVVKVKRSKSGQYEGVSISGMMNAASASLLMDIGKLEARKFAAKTKTEKRKIQKTITEKKKIYRKFKK